MMRWRRLVLAAVAVLQVPRGIATLLAVVPIELGLPLQAPALALFGVAVVHLRATEMSKRQAIPSQLRASLAGRGRLAIGSQRDAVDRTGETRHNARMATMTKAAPPRMVKIEAIPCTAMPAAATVSSDPAPDGVLRKAP